MGEAYEKARERLADKGQPFVLQEVIAKRIIEVARSGERNPEEICERALQAFGLTGDVP